MQNFEMLKKTKELERLEVMKWKTQRCQLSNSSLDLKKS